MAGWHTHNRRALKQHKRAAEIAYWIGQKRLFDRELRALQRRFDAWMASL
jgi:hypothetical protein